MKTVAFTITNPLAPADLTSFNIEVPEDWVSMVAGAAIYLEMHSKNPTFNFGAFAMAAVQLAVAFATKNPVAIAAAIQALIAALVAAK